MVECVILKARQRGMIMNKVMHTYTSVKVPFEAKKIVDEIVEAMEKATGTKPRKADVWIDAVKFYKEYSE